MSDYCQDHPAIELIPAEDSGAPTCWVCVGIRVAELADTCGLIGPDGESREVSREEFVACLEADARGRR
jgi:hypothetical protein